MQRLFKNLLISFLLPNLALGQSVSLLAAAKDGEHQPLSVSAPHKTQSLSVPPRTAPQTWLRRHIVPIVSVGVAFIAMAGVLSLWLEKQGLIKENQDLTTANSELKVTVHGGRLRSSDLGEELEGIELLLPA
jgi:hypothetical protein